MSSDNQIQIVFKAEDLTGPAFDRMGDSFKAFARNLKKTTKSTRKQVLSFKRLEEGAKGLGRAFKGAGRQLVSLKGLVAGVGLGLLVGSFIEAASVSEQFNTRLTIMLGSVEEGNRLFADMKKFASEVPFEFQEIMESATQLSGVLKGGVAEINEWMPLIGDLAATSGLSIQKTTEQVQRMLSAGAASADLFRERGVTAMLGFTSGVSYSVGQTRQMLMNAWTEPQSRFRGATKALSTTWEGLMSMISDKWFELRTVVMDAGLMDYFKAIAMAVDAEFGKALKDSSDKSSVWVNFIIDGIRSVMNGIGMLVNIIATVSRAWKGMKVAFAAVAESIISRTVSIAETFRELANVIPGIDIGPMHMLNGLLESSRLRTELLTESLRTSLGKALPGDQVEAFTKSVELNFEKLQNKIEGVKSVVTNGGSSPGFFDWEAFNNASRSALEEKYLILTRSLMTEAELHNVAYEQQLLDLENSYLEFSMSDELYRDQKEKLEEQHLRNMSNQNKGAIKGSFEFGQAMRKKDLVGAAGHAVSMLAQARNLSGGLFKLWKAAALANALVSLPSAIIRSYENAGGYPWGIVPATLMALAGAAQIKQIVGTSQAHGGLDYVPRDETFLLRAGERVVQPEANRDLTSFLANSPNAQTGSSVVVENFNFYMESRDFFDISISELQELIAEKFIPALDALAARGIKQEALTTMEAL